MGNDSAIGLTGRRALVTGGAGGIGRDVVDRLTRAGCDVAIAYNESHSVARELVQQCRDAGRTSLAVQADLTDPTAVARIKRELDEKFGPVDILVNNAGAVLRPSDWNVESPDSVRRTIAINLESVLYCIREFAPSMKQRRWGRIVNVTSTYSFNGAAAVMAYTAAKAGVNAVTKALAVELAPSGVLVNAVAPGNVDTAMTRSAGEQILKWIVSTTPVGRLARPPEIAEAVLFLVESEFICGHILVVDGGQVLRI